MHVNAPTLAASDASATQPPQESARYLPLVLLASGEPAGNSRHTQSANWQARTLPTHHSSCQVRNRTKHQRAIGCYRGSSRRAGGTLAGRTMPLKWLAQRNDRRCRGPYIDTGRRTRCDSRTARVTAVLRRHRHMPRPAAPSRAQAVVEHLVNSHHMRRLPGARHPSAGPLLSASMAPLQSWPAE